VEINNFLIYFFYNIFYIWFITPINLLNFFILQNFLEKKIYIKFIIEDTTKNFSGKTKKQF